jgi:hypothetical protein
MLRAIAFAIALPLLLAAPASALVIQLGDQDFANGAFSGLFDPPSAGEPPPFDAFRGDDNLVDFSESWTFDFAPGAYASGTITIGIYDHDSASPGNQLAAFGFDGNDLTALLDVLFESSGGAQLEINVYTLALPAETLADLADGSATFTLTLQGITLSGMGVVLPNNGAGLDFSSLTVEPGGRLPIPSTLPLLAAGLLGALALARRGRRSP